MTQTILEKYTGTVIDIPANSPTATVTLKEASTGITTQTNVLTATLINAKLSINDNFEVLVTKSKTGNIKGHITKISSSPSNDPNQLSFGF